MGRAGGIQVALNFDLKSMFNLQGKTALVTGGSKGLGLQIAEALGEFGASLFLVARKQADLDEVVTGFRQAGIEATGYAADLSDPKAIAQVAEAATGEFGRIDILVNNAGAAWAEPAETHSLQGWQKLMDINLTGPFLLSQEIARRSMIPAKSGSIINIASVEGLKGHLPEMDGTIAYNTSKGGAINFTRALAAEWGKYNIRVNALAPGYFPSKMTNVFLDTNGELIKGHTPLGRLGGPSDMKGPALMLASDAGGHVSGQIIAIDGGATIV